MTTITTINKKKMEWCDRVFEICSALGVSARLDSLKNPFDRKRERVVFEYDGYKLEKKLISMLNKIRGKNYEQRRHTSVIK